MSFSSDDNNSLPQLVELSAKMEETLEGADIHVTLSIQPDEIDIGDHTLNVAFRTAYLAFDAYFGTKAEPSSKFGMRKIPEITERKNATEKNVKAGVSVSDAAEAVASGKMSFVDFGLEQSIKGSKNRTATRDVSLISREERIFKHIAVEAIGDDRWKITEEENGTLRGYYLSGERLCQIVQRQQRSNRIGAAIRVQVKRKDIDVSVTQARKLWATNNREKLIGILVAKHLGEQAKDASDDVITFSSSEVSNEG